MEVWEAIIIDEIKSQKPSLHYYVIWSMEIREQERWGWSVGGEPKATTIFRSTSSVELLSIWDMHDRVKLGNPITSRYETQLKGEKQNLIRNKRGNSWAHKFWKWEEPTPTISAHQVIIIFLLKLQANYKVLFYDRLIFLRQWPKMMYIVL